MALTDTAARKAQPRPKAYKLADAGGLYLYVTPKGFKSWRLKYRFGPKEKTLTFGAYPEVTLAEARDRRDDARRQLRDNKDPGVQRHVERATALADADATFETVARRWHHLQLARWSPRYGRLIMFALERDLLPRLGRLPIKSVTAATVLATLRAIEDRGAIETAHRLRQQISAIFVFAIAEGLVSNDPSASLAKGLRKVPKATKFPAITELNDLRAFVRAIDNAQDIGPIVKYASRLLSLTAVRPGVIASAPWSEIKGVDWSGGFIGPLRPTWHISAERMKLDVDEKTEQDLDLVLPLSRQAVELLHQLHRLTSKTPWLFPSARGWRRHMSGDAIRMAYRRRGFGDDHVPHGWRASFSTIMNNRVKAAVKAGAAWRAHDREYLDLMLGHVPEGVSASELRYNRSEHFLDFHRLAQEWADLLLSGQRSAEALMFVEQEG